jgi:hypothetical protein
MANGVKRFQTHGRQFIPIVREVGQPEKLDAALLSLHEGRTRGRAISGAPKNRFVGSRMSGSKIAGVVSGASFNSGSNSKFV